MWGEMGLRRDSGKMRTEGDKQMNTVYKWGLRRGPGYVTVPPKWVTILA